MKNSIFTALALLTSIANAATFSVGCDKNGNLTDFKYSKKLTIGGVTYYCDRYGECETIEEIKAHCKEDAPDWYEAYRAEMRKQNEAMRERTANAEINR